MRISVYKCNASVCLLNINAGVRILNSGIYICICIYVYRAVFSIIYFLFTFSPEIMICFLTCCHIAAQNVYIITVL
jgi:hypothetical protein